MRKSEVVCDQCGKDLSKTGNCIGWRLMLDVEKIPSKDGPVTLLHVEPMLDHEHHFCHLVCLARWTNKLPI